MSTMHHRPLHKKITSGIASVIAWAVLVFGIFVAMAAIASGNFRETIAALTLSIAFILPPAWFFHCRSRDKKAFTQYHDAVRNEHHLKTLLGDDYPVVTRGMGTTQPPQRTPRRWGIIAAASLAAFFLGAFLFSEVEVEDPAPQEPVTDARP